MDGSTYVEFLKIIVICIMWYLCSASNNIIGKVVLLDFPYPMTMTMVQLLSVSVFLAPFLPCVGANKEGSHDRRYLFTMILPLAFGKFITSVSSFVSIWKVSVSYSHTGKDLCVSVCVYVCVCDFVTCVCVCMCARAHVAGEGAGEGRCRDI